MAIKFLSDQVFPTDIFLVDVSLGRVGVNTLLPRTALEVVGTIRVWSGANSHTYVETSSGSNLGSIQAKKNSDNATRSLALNPLGGNVGIGLGAGVIPPSKLFVAGETRLGNDINNYVSISSTSSSTIINTIGNGFVPPDVAIRTGGSDKLIIKNGGNVGIGTTNPSAKLHILDNAEQPQVLIGSDASNYLKVEVAGDGDSTISAVGSGFMAPDIKFNTNTSNILTINGAFGNVGIGTTTPGIKLDVIGNGIRTGTNAFNSVSISADSLGTVYSTSATGTGSTPDITFKANNTSRLFIKGLDGDVGIGTTNPRAKLDVDGGVKVANDTDTPSANKVGTLRYRFLPSSPKSQSKVDMCMQTGTGTYAWVNIVTNTWTN